MKKNPNWREEHAQNIAENKVEVISRQRGQGVVDPRDQFREAPAYEPGYLPPIFVNYVDDAVASWGGDKGAYACAFMAMHCSVLHSSVKMNTNPLKPNNFRNPNDFSLTLGKSGENKSGMFKDLTRHQDSWQKAMTRASSRVTSAKKAQPPMCFLQNASVEGMMLQIHDNKGERLLIGNEEAMGFYDGAAIHHKDNAANAMSDAVCAVYDGGSYSKRLVNKAYSIPEALGTLVMTTTIDKIVGWKAFKAMVESGLMARHTFGVISHPEERDEKKLIPDADQVMGDVLLKMRGMRDTRFILADDARAPWLNYTKEREQENAELLRTKAPTGLLNWIRKYDLRVMTMATILQIYDFIDGGMIDCETVMVPSGEEDAGKTDGGEKPIKTVRISKTNLGKAIDFIEGYLYEVQEFFYRIAAGTTEFGDELLNFIAYRVTSDEPDNPDCRIIPRDMFTSKGPAACRGAITDELKATQNRWIQACIDHGYVEVYDHPRARKETKFRRDCEERWFKLRDEVFETFADQESRDWLRAQFEKSREVHGMRDRKRLRMQ